MHNLREAELNVLISIATKPKPEVAGKVAEAELPPGQMKYAKLIYDVHKKLNHVLTRNFKGLPNKAWLVT